MEPSPGWHGRLIVVSNRLPVSISRNSEGLYECKSSSGGLVTGLNGLANHGSKFVWYGWLGANICQEELPQLKESLLLEHNAVPVLLERQTVEGYYNGFSNSAVWPLLHSDVDNASHSEDTLSAYREANEVFADAIAPDLEDGDLVWVHDYHLMLLPLLLRRRAATMGVQIRTGWFLHTPFPEPDFFSLLPDKADFLNGILGADLIGFQTDEARLNFVKTCYQILGLRSRSLDTQILHSNREISIGTFPIGVEPGKFQDRLRDPGVQSIIRNMRDSFKGAKVIVGVDRLDHIKGMPHKLQAFDKFLEKFPEWVGRVILIQVAIPSRTDLKVNQELKVKIQQLVGEINGKHGRINYVPVQFLYQSLDADELTALYTASDICFVSSTRDGMNLVSYEYVACHNKQAVKCSLEPINSGTLILSRYAGAAGILDGCLIVDPWNQERCAEVLAHALNIDSDEADKRMTTMGRRVQNNTSHRWRANFVRALAHAGKVEGVRDPELQNAPVPVVLQSPAGTQDKRINADFYAPAAPPPTPAIDDIWEDYGFFMTQRASLRTAALTGLTT